MPVPETFLALMEREPLHGYELRRRYDTLLGMRRPLRSGQIYSTLSRLERDGLVAPDRVDQGTGPERAIFQVTGSGTDHLQRWFDQPEPTHPFLQPELYAKVILALLTGRDASRILDAQRSAHRSQMRSLTKIFTDDTASLLDVAAADLAIMHLDADLRWIDRTEARLVAMRTEMTRQAQ